jgi:hypothetical protein
MACNPLNRAPLSVPGGFDSRPLPPANYLERQEFRPRFRGLFLSLFVSGGQNGAPPTEEEMVSIVLCANCQPDREAVFECLHCGDFLCGDCAERDDTHRYGICELGESDLPTADEVRGILKED